MNKFTCIRQEADQELIHEGKNLIESLQPFFHEKAKVFNLLGNEVRLQIMLLLHADKRLCVCDMSDILSMNVSAISQHLRKLKDGGLVISNREAQTIYYSITPIHHEMFTELFHQLLKPAEK